MIVSYFFVFLFLGLIAYVAYFQTVESSEYLKGQYSQYDKRQEKMAEQDGSLGLITGESIGQVASQTIHSLACTNEVCTMPVFRPLIGFDKQEIVDIALKIGTYETSVLPYEDCCTIFVAKHPVTKPNLNVIRHSEEKLADCIDGLLEEAIRTAEVIVAE